MITERFERWQPLENTPRRLEIRALRDEDEGLCVVVASEETRKPLMKLVFQDFVAYRNVNESFRIRTWQSHVMKGSSSLLIVHGSLWLDWLRQESGGVLDDVGLTHYAIYTNDDCIDVAARVAPLVLALDSP